MLSCTDGIKISSPVSLDTHTFHESLDFSSNQKSELTSTHEYADDVLEKGKNKINSRVTHLRVCTKDGLAQRNGLHRLIHLGIFDF